MKELKKAAFWKSAVFGLDCIRQEYAIYEELEHGLDMPLIKAVEVLESRLDFKPIDKDKCKIPFQDKIEAWLADNIKDF